MNSRSSQGTTVRSLSRRSFLGLGAALALASVAAPLAGRATQALAANEPQVVKIITSNQTKPYCFVNEDNELQGYDIDVLKLCEQKLGGRYQFQFDGMQFQSMVASLQSGACDLVSCAIARTPERLEKFIFPEESYCIGPMAAAVRKDSGISDVHGLAGKKLLVNPTNAYYQALVKYNDEHPDEAIELVEAENVGDVASWFRAVANGQADACYTLVSSFDSIQQGASTDLALTETVTYGLDFFMLRPGMEGLAADLSTALKEAKSDGSLGELGTKWLGGDVFAENADFLKEGADIIVGKGDTYYSVSQDGILVDVSAQKDAASSSSSDAKAAGAGAGADSGAADKAAGSAKSGK